MGEKQQNTFHRHSVGCGAARFGGSAIISASIPVFHRRLATRRQGAYRCTVATSLVGPSNEAPHEAVDPLKRTTREKKPVFASRSSPDSLF